MPQDGSGTPGHRLPAHKPRRLACKPGLHALWHALDWGPQDWGSHAQLCTADGILLLDCLHLDRVLLPRDSKQPRGVLTCRWLNPPDTRTSLVRALIKQSTCSQSMAVHEQPLHLIAPSLVQHPWPPRFNCHPTEPYRTHSPACLTTKPYDLS